MEGTSKKYASTGTPQDIKEYRATLALELEDMGVSLATFLKANNKTNYQVSQATLYRHVAALRQGDAPLSVEKKSGRPKKLSNENWDIVAGAILCAQEEVNLEWIVSFISKNFDVDYDESTICRKLDKLKLTLQMTGSRPMPKGMLREEYVTIYYNFILHLHNSSFFIYDPKKIVCIDFTTNSYRLERRRTYSISGGKQKKFGGAKPKYTDTFMGAFCYDDDMQYPALLCTHNKDFDPNGQRWAEVCQWCKDWNIETWRIVYVDSSKVYCAEAQWMVAHFKQIYRNQLKNARILIDAGNSFKKDGEQMLADGADRLEIFPSAPHGELSVCDNNIWSIAKKWWRLERKTYCGEDFTKEALHLLWSIDWVKKEAIKACWVRNYLLGVQKPTLVAVDEMLKQNNRLTFANADRQWQYVTAYETWLQEHANEAESEPFLALNTLLDGAYWN